jgi:hypothetical protein
VAESFRAFFLTQCTFTLTLTGLIREIRVIRDLSKKARRAAGFFQALRGDINPARLRRSSA